MEGFSQVSSNFALQLFKQVSVVGQNSFLSPASITMALAMTYAGADGNTKNQMNKIMFGEMTDDQINESLQQVVKVINEPVDGYVLRTANRLYCEKTYEVLQNYLDVVQKYYQSDCISSDFKAKYSEVRQEINKWVEEKTNDKIRDLLSPDAVNMDTRLVLVNAIYFKGDWKKPFEECETTKKQFYSSPNNDLQVDMMRGKQKIFKYGANEKYQVLGIPYKSPNVTMFFVLPTERYGLGNLEKELTGRALLDLFIKTYTTEVEVELPKFKLEQSFSLVQQLAKLGMTDMFLQDADFSKMSGSKDLSVSNVIHKAFIEVNEKGAEAAAATAITMELRCARPVHEPPRFIADHPFLFAIVEQSTKSILFLGHYYGPS